MFSFKLSMAAKFALVVLMMLSKGIKASPPPVRLLPADGIGFYALVHRCFHFLKPYASFRFAKIIHDKRTLCEKPPPALSNTL